MCEGGRHRPTGGRSPRALRLAGGRLSAFALVALLGLAACPRPEGGLVRPTAPEETAARRVALMGTDLDLEVTARSREAALAAGEGAVRALEAAEARLSTWREDSELSRLNRTPVGEAVALTPELARELEEALMCAQATRGAFDPTVGALVEAWGLRTGGRVPTDEALAEARARTGRLGLEVRGREARRLKDVRVEEGGFGKGAGLDRALEALRTRAVDRAWLSLGGQVALLGPARWVPLAAPRERTRPLVEVRVPAGSLATTGNSERGLLVGGHRYAHVLDPRSGRPAPDFGSLSVFAPSAAWADCLSTGLYVWGPDAALEWGARQPGVEVLVIEDRPDGPRIRGTDGLRLRCPETDAAACRAALARGGTHPPEGAP